MDFRAYFSYFKDLPKLKIKKNLVFFWVKVYDKNKINGKRPTVLQYCEPQKHNHK